jgi:hypothetical protein
MALLLRAAIPVGYMPAAVGSGLPFVLCPENIPAEFLYRVTGEQGGHSAHHTDHSDDHHCPVGHLLLSAFAVGDQIQFVAILPAPEFAPVPEYAGIPAAPRSHYEPRGPPA